MNTQTLNFENTKVLIVGDVMLDQYWFGDTARISPEAPIPVVLVDHVDERPGGAANVALGVQALGACATLLGNVGEDANALRLEQLLKKEQVDVQLERLNGYHTITKLRVLSRKQQMLRLDREKSFPPPDENFKKRYLELLENQDAVILSDYGKGSLGDPSWFIEQARARRIPVIVDPKSNDFSVYRGATVIKPNLKEFEAIVGSCKAEDILVEKAVRLLKEIQVEAIVISRSEKGLSIITQAGTTTHIAASAQVARDVTGAGDTVVAVLATALGAGLDLIKAARLGNAAAGVAVEKLGAVTVSLPEIQATFRQENSLPLGIMTEESLLAALRSARMQGERIVFTNGCFDLLHPGHLQCLEMAKALGDRLIVAVNEDATVSQLKGPSRPVNPLQHRMTVLAALKYVDWVIPFSEETPERLIQRLSPDILAKGGEYTDIHALPGAKFVLSQGGRVELLGEKICSTTEVIEQMISKTETL